MPDLEDRAALAARYTARLEGRGDIRPTELDAAPDQTDAGKEQR